MCRLLPLLLILVAANSPLAHAQQRPNILFCIADDASYPHMSAYGCSWVETPGFDRVAREGLLFTRAYTPNAKCAPSRACILTGRNSWQLKEACNHWCDFPAEFKSYVEALDEHGYFVGKTGKGWAPGVARDRDGQPRQLTGRGFDAKRLRPPARAISPNDYAGNFEAFLEASPDDRPWCFWYGGYEPHRAYEYGAGVNKAGKKLEQIDQVLDFWPDNPRVRTDMLDYAYEIEHFDRHLQRMLDTLERRGELDNTLVVVTADNGMPFPRIKGQEYELSNHLPLAVMWKGGIQRPGRRIDDYVSFIDFAPTFLEAAGLGWDDSGMAEPAGRSLAGIFRSDVDGQVEPQRDHVLIGKERHDIGRPDDVGYPVRGIVKDNLLLLRNFETDRWPAGNPVTGYLNCDASPTKTEVLRLARTAVDGSFWKMCFGKRPGEELYDLKDDPLCMNNLAEDPRYDQRRRELSRQMLAELTAQADPRATGTGAVFDTYAYADRNTADFYNRYTKGEVMRAGWVRVTDFELQDPPDGQAPNDNVSHDHPETLGSIERLDPAIEQLLPADAKIEVLASGFQWSEGPLWVPQDGTLLFSDIPHNHIVQWKPDAGIGVFLERSGYTGAARFMGPEPGSNGLTLDDQGRLVMCCHGDRQIKRMEPDGKLTVLASHYQGKRLNSPNDLVYHSSGDLYFTDPPYGLPQRYEDPARELDFCGVYRLGKDGQLTLLSKEVTRPNGIGLSPDEKTLYVAQSDRAAYLWKAFPVLDDGTLGPGRVFYDAQKWAGNRVGGCDGMAIDQHGNLWATGPGGVLIFTPEAKLLGRLVTGQRTANCTFGGPDGRSLFVTADMHLCRVETRVTAAR